MSLMDLAGPFLLPVAALGIGAVHARMRNLRGTEALGIFLMWQIAIGFGVSYLFAGMGHLFAADRVAESIGWPAGSPFQREVGMWDAAMGIVGLLCLKFRDAGFWTAAVLGTGLFSIGAGLGHVYELVAHGDTSFNNAGPVMYFDLLYPVVLIALLWLLQKTRKEEAKGK